MKTNRRKDRGVRFGVLALALGLLLLTPAFADMDSDIRDLQLEKEKLDGEIQKLNRQIASTDSIIRADETRRGTLQQRYKEASERRRAEIDSLNSKIRTVASQLQAERGAQARAKNRADNVKSKRNALNAVLVSLCKKFEAQVAQTIPWERETRLDRVKSLTRDLESHNATEEEGFSRLKGLIAEETKFGDEVAIVNSPLTRKNGELVNAQILRIGNQWMVYSDENATVFGSLVRKRDCSADADSAKSGETRCSVTYEWNEDLDLNERAAVKLALDVKLAKKPPQIVTLPVSLSIEGDK